MDELKPKLILTKRTKSGATRFTFFLILLVVFALGVFVGTKIKNVDIQVVKKKEDNINNSEMRVQDDQKRPSHKEDRLSVTTPAMGPVKNGEESKSGELKPQESKPSKKSEIETDKYAIQVAALIEGDRYTIQVAAFKEMERAQRVANELKEKGYDAYMISTYNSRGEAWNLVKMGKFKTKEEAQDFASLFQKKESMETIVEELNGQ